MNVKSAAYAGYKSIPLSIALPAAAFVLPILVSGPQLITGTLVNALLYYSSKKLTGRNLIITAIAPGLGAVSHGILFGSYTPYLVFLLPAIWIGNMVLVFSQQKLTGSVPRPVSIVTSSLLKSGVIYIFTLTLVTLHILPTIFLTAMGIIQLVTAIIGGFLVYERRR
jgi:hypothetical protein